MSKFPMMDMKGAAAGDFELADSLLSLHKGDQAVHEAVLAHLAAMRAGTASTLGKGAVAGSNRKPWKQKHTGRARAGYRRSPVWRGGGVAHGPHPRDFGMRIPKKIARLAFRRAFSARAADGAVRVLSELALAEAKTRALVAVLKAIGVSRGVLLVVDRVDPAVSRAARNIPGVEIVAARQVTTYQLLRHPQVVVTRAAMADVVARLEAGAGRAA